MNASSEESNLDELSGSELESVEATAFNRMQSVSILDRYGEIRCPLCPCRRKHPRTRRALFHHAAAFASSSRRCPSLRVAHRALARILSPQQPNPANVINSKSAGNFREDERFVWPWMCILVNVPDGTNLKKALSCYNPFRIICLPDSNCAVAEFDPNWAGFARAMMFENLMISCYSGKKQWNESECRDGGKLCGWVARTDDYHATSPVGVHLHQRSDVYLKTVSEILAEDEANLRKHVDIYTDRVKEQKRNLCLMECSLDKVTMSVEDVLAEIKRNHHAYNEEMQNLPQGALQNARSVFKENEKLRLELDLLKKQIHIRCKQVNEVLIKLDNQCEEIGILERIQRQLEESDLFKAHEELEGLRELLVTNSKKFFKGESDVGIREVDQIELLPFRKACEQKFYVGDIDAKAANLCLMWQEELKNHTWHPYKVIHVGGKVQEVIDENDEKLQYLRNKFGDHAFNAVVTALMEISHCDPSSRFISPELWNFKEGRRATLKEIFQNILRKWKDRKRRRIE